MKLPAAGSFVEFGAVADFLPLAFAVLLLLILVVSFRSRATVFCQYLKTMTGVKLSPKEVRRVYRAEGQDGVRSLFLDLIIREDLKTGPLQIPEKMKSSPPPDPAPALRGKTPA